MQNIKNPKGCS